MNKIEKQVIDEIKSLNKKISGNDNVNKFEEMNDCFNDLVKRGVVKKRGYNLRCVTDFHVNNQAFFNAK